MSATKWDRHAILAEVRRRGSTLTEISRQAGEPRDTASVALRQGYPKGERIISEFLGVPVEELWPERYPNRSQTGKTNAANAAKPSQKRKSRADMRDAA